MTPLSMSRRSVLIFQVDGGAVPNLALMRIAAEERRRGSDIEFRHAKRHSVRRGMFDAPDAVYASAIFERSKSTCELLLREFPGAIIGGSGWNEQAKLPDIGIERSGLLDYSLYPEWPHSIGFTQRGCRLACPFCKVPRMEGKIQKEAKVEQIWRGEPWPKNLLLLDNDFFGEPTWRSEIDAINQGGFKICWNQGFNVRLIGDEEAAAIASTNYRNADFTRRRLYTAWDNRKDEKRLFRNLEALVKYGVKPDEIMVYILVGFWDGPTLGPDDLYRHAKLREFGCRPYPMPFVRNDELRGFQRWCARRDDLKVSWQVFKAANYRPEKIGLH